MAAGAEVNCDGGGKLQRSYLLVAAGDGGGNWQMVGDNEGASSGEW